MIPLLSYGMGVESTAILLRWLHEPDTCLLPDGTRFNLSDLIVVTSQVGDEFEDTGTLVDTHILPLLRQHNIRWVQLGRKNASTAAGHVVLEDSRQPTRTFLEAQYRLSEEMFAAGTVPQYAGVHKCSLKFKATVIEGWLAGEVYGKVAHAFGYNAEELKRVAKSERHIAEAREVVANRVAMGFGFNSEELKRVAKGEKNDHVLRTGFYPLVTWNWTRQQCKDYIRQQTGADWKKSACVFCPFSVIKPRLMERHKAHPDQIAQAMLMEHTAVAFNPKSGSLYKNQSLYEVVVRSENQGALDRFEQLVQASPWALYHVRRIRRPGKGLNSKGQPKKATPIRCVEVLVQGTEAEARSALYQLALEQHLTVVKVDRVERVHRVAVGPSVREELFTIVPATAQAKVRDNNFEAFEHKWGVADDLYCGVDDYPLFDGLEHGQDQVSTTR